MPQTALRSLLAPLLVLAACGGVGDGSLIEGTAVDPAADGKADQPSIPTTTFDDDVGTRAASPARKLFTCDSAYRAYFGHSAPAEVDFATDWVVFYAVGTEPTDGYQAEISRVALSSSGRTIRVTTALTSPGATCVVTDGVTTPYALVRFSKPSPAPRYVSYRRADTTRDCTCIQRVLCVMGSHFDNNPAVCSCVPDADPCAGVVCPTGSHCKVVGGAGVCASQCDGVTCPPGEHCEVVGNAVSCRLGIPCGTTLCTGTDYCCNASCGLCAPRGALCIQQVCSAP